ncbi:MAG TPA: hypothetical protein VNV63_00525, partial [Nitrospiria bacterium]|nr:hypothetical protein [Nitrospiria bacterium]
MNEVSKHRRDYLFCVVFLVFISAVIASACRRAENTPLPADPGPQAGTASPESPSNPVAAGPITSSLQSRITNFETDVNIKTMALEGDYLWMGLSTGIIRYDTRTKDQHQVYTTRSTG